MPKLIENILIESFKNRHSFSREELFDFFCEYEPNLKEGTFGWRIYDLKNRNIIKPLKRGLYVISYKPEYSPGLTKEIIGLSKHIHERFTESKYCIWTTEWLNEFSRHQAAKKFIIIEIERGLSESLFYEFKDANFKNEFYLDPDKRMVDFYIAESKSPVIIKTLITRSPIIKRKEKNIPVFIPQLEKMLVDVFAEKDIFYFYHGSELARIYESAVKTYTINFTKLFSYARRRQKEQEIKAFFNDHLSHLLKDIIDD